MTDTKQPKVNDYPDGFEIERITINGKEVCRKTPIGNTTHASANEIRRLHRLNKELLEALKEVFPNNLNAINKNVPDTTVIPLDFTYGELRKISAAIAKAEVTK
jgi:hypothetical protein